MFSEPWLCAENAPKRHWKPEITRSLHIGAWMRDEQLRGLATCIQASKTGPEKAHKNVLESDFSPRRCIKKGVLVIALLRGLFSMLSESWFCAEGAPKRH